MKKNIKLTQEHAELVRENMGNFKNDVLKKLAQEMYGGTAVTGKAFSEAFLQGGWKRSS